MSFVYFSIAQQLADLGDQQIRPNACVVVKLGGIIASSYTKRIENAVYYKYLDLISQKYDSAKQEANNKKLGLDKKPVLSRPTSSKSNGNLPKSGIKPLNQIEEKKEEWMKAKTKEEANEMFLNSVEFRKSYIEYSSDNLIMCEDDILTNDTNLQDSILFMLYLPLKISSCLGLIKKGIREIHYINKTAFDKPIIDYLNKGMSVVFEKKE